MPIPTYEVSLRVEYASGYAQGLAQGIALLTDQASVFVPEVEASFREFVRTSAAMFTRAYALGLLRGFRHSTWGVR